MSDNVDDCVDRVADGSRDAPVFVFFGAGGGHSHRLPPDLRLPLGNQIRDALLERKYPTETLTADERVEKFSSEFNVPTTPDFVWHAIIKEPGRLSMYYPDLMALFSPEHPIPAAYYMLARWFFTAENVGGLATTNFDDKIDQAFSAVARNLNKRRARDYYIPSVKNDFSWVLDSSISTSRLVQKVHGSIAMPWSIVAGIPEPDATVNDHSPKFSPRLSYEKLGRSLEESVYWIVLGFSFKDDKIFDVFLDALQQQRGISLYIVDPAKNPAVTRFIRKSRELGTSHEVSQLMTHAEDFMGQVLARIESNRNQPTPELPDIEKTTLVDGPQRLPGWTGRITAAGDSPFTDTVYGEFSYSDPVRKSVIKLIDCGELQRLRYIKQLSLFT